jgi:hypothetical protein
VAAQVRQLPGSGSSSATTSNAETIKSHLHGGRGRPAGHCLGGKGAGLLSSRGTGGRGRSGHGARQASGWHRAKCAMPPEKLAWTAE